MTTEQAFTVSGITDALYLNLMNVKDNYYQNMAWDLLRKIPKYKPTPIYEIKSSHLYDDVKKELEDRWNYRDAMDRILKEAVSKIFLNTNAEYFLLSVKPLLKVRLVP
jgi:hypothetical protein